MTKLKRIALITMVVVMALCLLTGCKNEAAKDEAAKDVNDTTVEENKNNDTAAPEAEGSTDAGAPSTGAQDGVIKMATNAYFKPYEYYDGETIVGIDAEIAKAIADKLGKKLEIVDMQFDSIITAVNEGSVDFGMAGMTVTEDRLKEVDFSTSYANGVQSVIVPEDSAIKSVDDLFADGATYKAGVQLGTTGDIYASDDLGKERVTQYANGNEAVMALKGKSIDCVIIDNQPAKALVAANAGLKILDTSYADEDYAICVKKGNKELLDQINGAIDALIEDGTVDTIIKKYIK